MLFLGLIELSRIYELDYEHLDIQMRYPLILIMQRYSTQYLLSPQLQEIHLEFMDPKTNQQLAVCDETPVTGCHSLLKFGIQEYRVVN